MPKSWRRRFQGQAAHADAVNRSDGYVTVTVWVGHRRILMTQAEWGALPIYWR
jgi:hypothetical protein